MTYTSTTITASLIGVFILNAAVSSLLFKRYSDNAEEPQKIVITNYTEQLTSIPMDATEQEMTSILSNLNDDIEKIVAGGFIVIDKSTAVHYPESVYYDLTSQQMKDLRDKYPDRISIPEISSTNKGGA